jgi:hypothetical protein
LIPVRRRWWDCILPPKRDGGFDWPRVPSWFMVGLLKMLLFNLSNSDKDDVHGEETQAAHRVHHCSFVRTNLVIICD